MRGLLLLLVVSAGACSTHPSYGRPAPRDSVPPTPTEQPQEPGLGPVQSARDAVRASIVQTYREEAKDAP